MDKTNREWLEHSYIGNKKTATKHRAKKTKRGGGGPIPTSLDLSGSGGAYPYERLLKESWNCRNEFFFGS